LGVCRQTLSKNLEYVLTVKLPTGALLINRASLNEWLTSQAVSK